MHVNGHFSLDNVSRRGLWKDDKKAYRTEWNNLLLCHIIAPIYAKAMEYLQKVIGLDSPTRGHAVVMHDKINKFHSFFPNIENASGYYWRDFMRAVYKVIAKKQMRMFLSYRCVDQTDLEVLCFSLHEDNGNVLFVDTTKNKKDNEIIEISKNLGAKLVDTPSWVCASIESASETVNKFHPDRLLGFLKSPSCKIKCHIEKHKQLELRTSSLKTVCNVKICLEFCMKCENFFNNIEGLPLCLLETGYLVKFCFQQPVFLTSFSDLIPTSKSKLLHHELHYLLQNQELRCIEKLNLQRLVELLPIEIGYDLFRREICLWNPNQPGIPNKIWLRRLWIFLQSEVGDIQDQTQLKRILHPILPWTIIPTTSVCGKRLIGFVNDVKHELFPLENATHVINLSTFQSTMLESLRKLNLPSLNSDFLPSAHPLHHLVSSQNRIQDVIECLFVHRHLIKNNNSLNVNDCDTVLEYFAGGLNQLLKMPNWQQCLYTLRKLPLFTTVHGEKIDLEENRDILALPQGLPSDGMNSWAKKTRKILLRQNNRIKCIYKCFHVTEQSICEVYAVHILPFFHNIPEENRMKHLIYIRDNLLIHSGRYDNEQICLIKALKTTPFVPLRDGSNKLASDFFSPFNELMALMCENSSQFPPKPFDSSDWKTFMTSAGMKTEITTDLFLKFALQQESDGRHGLSEQLGKKSKCLVRQLFISTNLSSTEFLERVGKIKFIVPYKIEDLYCKIFSYPTDKSNQLISFSGAVQSKYLLLAWTQQRLLPSWIDNETLNFNLSKLGVQQPSRETIIKHIKTVCDHLGTLSETKLSNLNLPQISKIIRTFYEYTIDPQVLPSLDVEAFQKMPFVFVSDFPGIFPCERFTLYMDKTYKMKPFLMALPDEYLNFIKLFEKFGASRQISSKTFAKILRQIHSIGDKLSANELSIAQSAMKYFFESLPPANVIDEIENHTLFLLSREGKLIDSKSIVYMNDFYYERILSEKHDFNVLSDIVGMNNAILEMKLKSLPSKIRPKFISDVIKMHVDTRKAQISENNAGRDINNFLKSDEFINGVFRLLNEEQLTQKGEHYSDAKIANIKRKLCRIRMICAKGMQRVYSYEGKEIKRQECLRHFELAEENGETTCLIYADFVDENDAEKVVIKNTDYISKAIRQCTGCSFHITGDLLSMVCLKVKNPYQIENLLDDRQISSVHNRHKIDTFQFPKPGDVVEIRWHGILDNDFLSFEIGEYVAYISGMNERGDVEYRYAIIKEILPCPVNASNLALLRTYCVEFKPQEMKEMKVYELYKFNRTKESENMNIFEEFRVEVLRRPRNTEDGEINSTPGDNRTLEEIFKEVRECLKNSFTLPEAQRKTVCRRIMLKWHPDKHPDDVTKATKIFQYIRKLIQKLENGENVDVDDTKESSNKRHPWSDNFFHEFDRCFRRQQEYQRRNNGHRYWSFNSSRTEYQGPQSSNTTYHSTEHSTEYQGPQSSNTTYHSTEHSTEYQGPKSSNTFYQSKPQPKNTYRPNPQPYRANIWLNEAKYDMRFVLQSETTDDSYSSWICFISYKAAEKALIAWQYNEDAKRVNRSENLSLLAQSCPEYLRQLATQLQNLTRGPQKTMYPDDSDHQPSKVYSKAQAIWASELANKIIDKVDKFL